MDAFERMFAGIRSELDSSQKPLFFFDDDPDGLSSFLLLYRYVKRGKGVIVKSTPKLLIDSARKGAEYGADKIFALDLPMVEQEFIDASKAPVVWVDHHTPLKRENVTYFNPREIDPKLYYPVSLVAYNVVKQDMWIAAAGVTGDFLVPPFLKEFKKQYPGYVGNQKTPEGLLFKTKLGRLVQVFSMILKGPNSKVMQCIKVLTRVEHPDEILEQTSARGRFVYKYAEKHLKIYDTLAKEAVGHYNAKDRLMLFVYPGSKLSLTSDLALELIYRFPKKIVVVAREKSEEMKLSIRSRGYPISDALKKALVGVEGYGGGHECACGANVAKKDFEKFLTQLRDNLP